MSKNNQWTGRSLPEVDIELRAMGVTGLAGDTSDVCVEADPASPWPRDYRSLLLSRGLVGPNTQHS